MAEAGDAARTAALDEHRRKLVQHRELYSRVQGLRTEVAAAKSEYDKTEDDLKALQSVGQIIGEVLRQLDAERCAFGPAMAPPRRHALARGGWEIDRSPGVREPGARMGGGGRARRWWWGTGGAAQRGGARVISAQREAVACATALRDDAAMTGDGRGAR